MTYFGFTATPGDAALRLFGVPAADDTATTTTTPAAAGPEAEEEEEARVQALAEAASNHREVVRRKAAYVVSHLRTTLARLARVDGFRSARAMLVVRGENLLSCIPVFSSL